MEQVAFLQYSYMFRLIICSISINFKNIQTKTLQKIIYFKGFLNKKERDQTLNIFLYVVFTVQSDVDFIMTQHVPSFKRKQLVVPIKLTVVSVTVYVMYTN